MGLMMCGMCRRLLTSSPPPQHAHKSIHSQQQNHPTWAIPYNGIVEIASGEIAPDVAFYLASSEQRNTAIGVGLHLDPATGAVESAGGFYIEMMPGVEEDSIVQVEANLADLKAKFGSLDPGQLFAGTKPLTPYRLVKELLYGLGVSTAAETFPQYKCSCSKDKVFRAMKVRGLWEWVCFVFVGVGALWGRVCIWIGNATSHASGSGSCANRFSAHVDPFSCMHTTPHTHHHTYIYHSIYQLLSEDEIDDILAKEGRISARCEFCNEVRGLLASLLACELAWLVGRLIALSVDFVCGHGLDVSACLPPPARQTQRGAWWLAPLNSHRSPHHRHTQTTTTTTTADTRSISWSGPRLWSCAVRAPGATTKRPPAQAAAMKAVDGMILRMWMHGGHTNSEALKVKMKKNESMQASKEEGHELGSFNCFFFFLSFSLSRPHTHTRTHLNLPDKIAHFGTTHAALSGPASSRSLLPPRSPLSLSPPSVNPRSMYKPTRSVPL
jgi:hypothetical protein